MSFQENLIRARKARGMTQEELAARLSISRQAVSKWETGESLPHCQVMNSRKRQPQRKIFVAAVLIGGLKQKNPRLYQGNKNFSIA